MNAERSVGEDLGFVLEHQLNTSQPQHLTTKKAKHISEINWAVVSKRLKMILLL